MTQTFYILAITGILGAVATYLASHHLKLGAVKASAFLSLAVALFFYVFPNLVSEQLTTEIPAVFFGASFAGMVSKDILPKLWQVALSGLLFAIIYFNTSYFFTGYGGGLGTTACISIVLVFGIKMILIQLKSKRPTN